METSTAKKLENSLLHLTLTPSALENWIKNTVDIKLKVKDLKTQAYTELNNSNICIQNILRHNLRLVQYDL